MALRARLVAPPPLTKTVWPWHSAKWATVSASTIFSGDRRLEAETYLATAYGLRIAMESHKTGWTRLDSIANVLQPSRLKAILVAREHGTPFLAATQVFDLRPTPRKWLALDQIGDADSRFAEEGTILVTRSGTVGRTTLAYRPHKGVLLSDDLLRVVPQNHAHWGWLYAFLRSSKCRAIMTAAQYGHMIKHLEVSHLGALPVPTIEDDAMARFNKDAAAILEKRNRAVDLLNEAEGLVDERVGQVAAKDKEAGFEVSASFLSGGRRRLEASYHHPQAAAILRRFQKLGLTTEPLENVTERVWWMTRFKRVFGEDGMPYMSADELFSLNPTITKRVLAEQASNFEDYMVKAGWIVMACSGQTYGLNGSVALMDKQHEACFFSHDLVRIVAKADRIRPGYLFAALGHPRFGRPLVIRHAYGTSIPHLDPGDVATIPIVRFEKALEDQIANRMEKAAELRGEADALENVLAERADQVIEDFLHRK